METLYFINTNLHWIDFVDIFQLAGTGAVKPNLDFSEYKPESGRTEDIARSAQEIAKLIVLKELNTSKSDQVIEKPVELTPVKRNIRQDSSTTIEDNGSLKSVSSRTSSLSNSSKIDSSKPSKKQKSQDKDKANICNPEKKTAAIISKKKMKEKESELNSKHKANKVRLDEQDAKFAITALKMKYKDQRNALKKSPVVVTKNKGRFKYIFIWKCNVEFVILIFVVLC